MRNLFRRFIDNQSGVTAIEYSLIGLSATFTAIATALGAA